MNEVKLTDAERKAIMYDLSMEDISPALLFRATDAELLKAHQGFYPNQYVSH